MMKNNKIENDYAEYRQLNYDMEGIPYGRCVCENGDNTLSISEHRLQAASAIITDTFGYGIGETDEANVPIAVAGRVLVYPYENITYYQIGDCVCAAPNGTVSKMTRDEIKEYPDRILGIVTSIPEYELGTPEEDKRIWIRIK